MSILYDSALRCQHVWCHQILLSPRLGIQDASARSIHSALTIHGKGSAFAERSERNMEKNSNHTKCLVQLDSKLGPHLIYWALLSNGCIWSSNVCGTHTHLLDAALDGKRTDQSDQDSRVAMSHRHLRQKSIKGLTLTQISIHMYYIVLSCIHKRPQKSKNCTCLFSARPKSEAIQNIQIAPKTDATKLQNDNVDGHTLTIAIIAQESSQPVLVPHWHERSPHASGRSRCAQVAPDAKIKAGSAAGPVEAPKIKTFTNA